MCIRDSSHRVRVIEDERRSDPFLTFPTFATPQHRRLRERDALAGEVGELRRQVSALTRYVERLGATPPRLVSRGGAFGARHGTYGGSFGGRDASLSVRRSANSDGGGGGGGGGRIHFREPSRSPPDSAIDWEDNSHLHGGPFGLGLFEHPAGGSSRYDRPLSPHRSCLLYTSPSPRDATLSRMPSSA